MKKLWFQLGLMLIFFVGVSLAADSLAELAKKEKERRAKMKATKTFTNQDIEDYKAKHPTPGSGYEGSGKTEGTETAKNEEGKEKDKTNSEEYWRGRYQETNDRVKGAQEKSDGLQSDINALTRSFYAEGDGVAQRGQIEAERNQRLEDLEAAKKELEEAKQAEEDLQEEARRAGAPPGWLRD